MYSLRVEFWRAKDRPHRDWVMRELLFAHVYRVGPFYVRWGKRAVS